MSHAKAIAALQTLLGERLSLSKSDLDIHGRAEVDFPHTPPDAVAYPLNTEEVAKIVKICATFGCPIIPWGTGTSLEGHSLAFRGGVTLDMTRMNKVIAVNAADMDCRVQPGITRVDLNTELRATGLFFPVDPGANASIGGMAATRASGTTAVRYGTMRDNVMGLEVVLADGRIIQTGTRARKSSAGYDLTRLMVGSEGTLGVITELTLRLQGQPQATGAAVCAFDTVANAVDAVMATIQMGVPMARIELLDADCVSAVNTYSQMDFPIKPHLLLEFHGSDAAVAADAETVAEVMGEFGGSGFEWATKTEERNRLWKMRHDAYYAILGLRQGASAVSTDVCVPISQLATAVSETQADIADSILQGPILGHVGDGNFHAILLMEPGNAAERAACDRLTARMAERALRLGGTVTGEHGVGVGKLKYMQAEHGEAWDVMGQIKRALDPDNIMNPGKLVRQN